MALKNRVYLAGLLVLLTGLLTIVFTPLLVTGGLRLWIWWQTRSEKIRVEIGKIEAPLFRPVILHDVRVHTTEGAALRLDATAPRVVVSLNLRSTLLRTRGRAIRRISVDNLRAEMHRNDTGTPISENGWNALQRLLPDDFDLDHIDLRVEHGSSVILLRGVSINGSQIEAGRFRADAVIIVSPLFRQTFTELRGATNWQNDRLTIAGLTLSRGLDVQSITTDFSHLGRRRLGLEFDLDTFGGKIRARISNEWRSPHPNWNMAGSASDISLSQTAEAIGFTNRVGGLLHAGKFTFRGDPADPLRATTSLWAELTGPAFRDREADLIMLGISIYGRQLQLQQLYVKQKKNQLTLSGEASFPTSPSGWLRPDFRGNISASIDDLGEFATLFGGAREDFAGRVAIEGTVNARDRNLAGNLTASGSALTMFKNSIDAFAAQLKLKPSELEIEQLELTRKKDVLRVKGQIGTTTAHPYSGSLDATVANLAEYLPAWCNASETIPMAARIHAAISSGVWEARGAIDPPASSPLNFTATFPLLIGQDWNVFLTAPINLTVDFPSLLLAELPRCFSGGFFRSGILSGKLAVSETLRHPAITGDMQLRNGQLNNMPMDFTELSGRISFDGHKGTIDSLNAANKNAALALSGALDFADANTVAIQLFPTQPLFTLSDSEVACINKLKVTPATSLASAPIGEIDFRGGIFQANWTIILKEFALPNLLTPFPWDLAAREFRWCPANVNTSSPLILGVPPQAPKKAPPRPRRKR